jgi:ferrous iron transport protein B
MIPDAFNGFLEGIGVHPLLQALIVDGAIGGVGAVIGFLPLIMVLFFCLGLLEDSGYMARVAVVMDRYFKKIGLSGKSIIPMIVGSGCSIPGVMATRTIEDINEKRMTTMLTPFVPCGAKLPIIALFSAVFFPDASWVAPSMYILAFVMIAIGGLILKKIFVWENTSTFIMELPEYKIPSLVHAFKQMIKQAKAFIIKASTIILVMNTLIWFMQTYSWRLEVVEDSGLSILASIGGVIAPLLIPLGFVGWQLAAAALTGFIAKENVVATFAIILLAASEDALHMPGGVLAELFNPVTAYAYLVFNLFTPPCFAAIGAMNSELDSRKWLGRAVLFQLSVGYLLAMLITQIGTMIVYGELAVGFVPAIIVSILFTGLIVYLIKGADRKRIQTPALVH